MFAACSRTRVMRATGVDPVEYGQQRGVVRLPPKFTAYIRVCLNLEPRSGLICCAGTAYPTCIRLKQTGKVSGMRCMMCDILHFL